MERELTVTAEYLYLPICVGAAETKVEIFSAEAGGQKKRYEFMVPVAEAGTEASAKEAGNGSGQQQEHSAPAGSYHADYYAEVPVRELLGKRLIVRADAPDAFLQAIDNDKKRAPKQTERPVIHFTAETGWTNDPNGLIYADGIYHFYFQYNPFHTVWNNMSWGHATSRDLLHWSWEDSVMFPDESGTMFSGCAVANERELLGLPKEAILFYYTAAGGSNEWSKGVEFTQKIAYSLDGGKTLVKLEEPCLPTLFEENRDPKVYWHEETQAYVMALFLKGNDYGIFRSEDLKHWEQTDHFTLEDAWECPDFFQLATPEGETCWFFWTADGFYYPGEFDGYHFRTDGVRHHGYVNTLPYAAQTYVGTAGRTVMIPWLRMENDGRHFTGAYGIPVELSCIKKEEGFLLLQMPVRELMEQARPVEQSAIEENGRIHYIQSGAKKALVFEIKAQQGYQGHFVLNINGSRIEYVPESGKLVVEEEKYQAGCEHQKLLFLADDRILEVFFDDGMRMGAFVLKNTSVSLETSLEGIAEYAVYEVE